MTHYEMELGSQRREMCGRSGKNVRTYDPCLGYDPSLERGHDSETPKVSNKPCCNNVTVTARVEDSNFNPREQLEESRSEPDSPRYMHSDQIAKQNIMISDR